MTIPITSESRWIVPVRIVENCVSLSTCTKWLSITVPAGITAGVSSATSSYVPGWLMFTASGVVSVTCWRSSNARITVSLDSASGCTEAGGECSHSN